nr:hypothetical protein [Tanacetum cinerariifolium]
IEADVPLLGKLGEIGEPLGAEVDDLIVDPVIDELVEPIVEVEEQMVSPVVYMMRELAKLFGIVAKQALLFGNDNFSDDGPNDDEDDEEVWDVNEDWLVAPVTLTLMLVMSLPSTYEVGGPSTAAAEGHSLTMLAPGFPVRLSMIENLCTRMDNLESDAGHCISDGSSGEQTRVGQGSCGAGSAGYYLAI